MQPSSWEDSKERFTYRHLRCVKILQGLTCEKQKATDISLENDLTLVNTCAKKYDEKLNYKTIFTLIVSFAAQRI